MRRRVRPVSIPNEQFTHRPSWGDRNRLCSAVAMPPGTSKGWPDCTLASSAISLTRRMGGSDLVGDFKLVKWIKGIEFVADFRDIGSGYGGYSEDHKYFGRHQTL